MLLHPAPVSRGILILVSSMVIGKTIPVFKPKAIVQISSKCESELLSTK